MKNWSNAFVPFRAYRNDTSQGVGVGKSWHFNIDEGEGGLKLEVWDRFARFAS